MLRQTDDGLSSSSFNQLYKARLIQGCSGADGERTLQEQWKERDEKDQEN